MNQVIKTEFDMDTYIKVASDVLKLAKERGATQAELAISANKGFSVSAREASVETVEYHQDKSISIKVYFGKRSGSASLSDIRPTALKSAVEAACHIAKFTDEDPVAGLADKDEMAFGYEVLDPAYPWDISVQNAIDLAIECEQKALKQDKRIMSAESVSVNTGVGIHLYANSHGFIGHYPDSRHELACVLVAKDDEGMQRDFSYTVAVDPDMLLSVDEVARQAVERTTNRLNAKRLSTMKTPVIFHAEEARGLIGHFAAAISGGSLYRKSSFLLDCLGKQIFPSFVKIHEDPFIKKGVGSEPFDSDGVATRKNVFVEQGILKQYALGTYSARKMGMQTTANAGGMHNLIVEPGSSDLKALLKTMGRGLLITEMMGNGVHLITGDYSRGVAGFWVEDGEIQYPVHEITVASKLQDMYQGILAIGNDVDIRGNIRTGSILINEMTVAGE